MNRVPETELVLVPGGSLITVTAEEGRALAIARHMIHNIQPDIDILKEGRPAHRSRHHVPFGSHSRVRGNGRPRGSRSHGLQVRKSGEQIDRLVTPCESTPDTGPTRSVKRSAYSAKMY